jgi:hypothetical protein
LKVLTFRSSLFFVFAAILMCCRSGSAQMLEFEATAGLWVREIRPTTVYDNDGIAVNLLCHQTLGRLRVLPG